MHLFFYARGVHHQVEIFKTLAQCQFFRWERKIKGTGELDVSLVQGALRDSVLGCWEYIFPQSSLPYVLSIMGLTDKKNIGNAWGSFRLSVLRKILKVKAIPSESFDEAKKIPSSIVFGDTQRGLSNLIIPGVSFHPIGIKYDETGEMLDKNTGITYIQELL